MVASRLQAEDVLWADLPSDSSDSEDDLPSDSEDDNKAPDLTLGSALLLGIDVEERFAPEIKARGDVGQGNGEGSRYAVLREELKALPTSIFFHRMEDRIFFHRMEG